MDHFHTIKIKVNDNNNTSEALIQICHIVAIQAPPQLSERTKSYLFLSTGLRYYTPYTVDELHALIATKSKSCPLLG